MTSSGTTMGRSPTNTAKWRKNHPSAPSKAALHWVASSRPLNAQFQDKNPDQGYACCAITAGPAGASLLNSKRRGTEKYRQAGRKLVVKEHHLCRKKEKGGKGKEK